MWRVFIHTSDTGIGAVRPLQLDGVVPYLLCLPGTDVAYLAVVLIVPSLSWDRVSDSFAQFMGTCRRERIKRNKTARATMTVGIGHYSVKDLPFAFVTSEDCNP